MPDKQVATRQPLTKEERRARRDERREKQRAANMGRAAKMHAARLEAESPPFKQTPRANDTGSQKYYVGCSGWFYWHWRGIFYPAGLPPAGWFKHYLSHFNTVELNAPFYSWPTLPTVETWNRQAGRHSFVYTVKVCELITHVKRFIGTKTLIQDFSFIADRLGPRMGCFLFQLPPSFQYTPTRLRSILKQLHPATSERGRIPPRQLVERKSLCRFRRRGSDLLFMQRSAFADTLVKTADDIYIRFHGTSQWYRHNYSKTELIDWARKAKESGARHIYAYFNNDREGHAIKNAKAFLRLLQG